MKNHQKYFHLNDAATGALLPAFITVANIDSKAPARVIAGNERVIRPRLADAAFFFANDKRVALASRQARLASVVFQQKLGSLLDKTERMTNLAARLAESIGANADVTLRAAALAKCDLVSEMVLEFPELQGSAGAQYALNDGESAVVAQAIEEHYLPRFAGDDLPRSAEGSTLALADRLDTLVGIFGIGEPPTGSKDPFALRRASLAVIRILIDLGQPISLRDLLNFAQMQHTASLTEDAASAVLHYVFERLDSWYADQGVSADVVRAVLASSGTDLWDIDLRINALATFSTKRHNSSPPPTSASLTCLQKQTGATIRRQRRRSLLKRRSRRYTRWCYRPKKPCPRSSQKENMRQHSAHWQHYDNLLMTSSTR
jgi:glycyl-tRNA synthetase beta chain